MSDFLDRVAARAGDGATALAPRLPSLFEPLQRAPLMAVAETTEAAPEPRRANAHSETTEQRADPPAPRPRAAATAEPSQASPSLRAADASPAVSSTKPPQATPALEKAVVATHQSEPAPAAALRPSPRVMPASPPPSPILPRALRRAPEPTSVATATPATGSLLPPATPVFATPPMAASARAAAGAARRASTTTSSPAAAAPEPVVHVSIGRIEVRAAPTPTAPARRRDGPQPASLDDYLRQRGKVSP